MDELDNLINELNNPLTFSSNSRNAVTSNAVRSTKTNHSQSDIPKNEKPNPQFSELDSLMADLVDAKITNYAPEYEAGMQASDSPLQELLRATKEHVDYSRALPKRMTLTKSTSSSKNLTGQNDNETHKVSELKSTTDRPHVGNISGRAPPNSVYPTLAPNHPDRDSQQNTAITNSADALNQLLYEQEALAKRRNQSAALGNIPTDPGSASAASVPSSVLAKIDLTKPSDHVGSAPPTLGRSNLSTLGRSTLGRGEGLSVQNSTLPRTIPAGQPGIRNVICPQCNKPVEGASFTALHRIWHPDHFICNHCKKKLGSLTFFEHEGLPYCAEDYHELFSPRCGYCSGVITEQCITAIGKVWHPDHFFCCQCGKNFADGGFMEHDGRAYCEDDYFNMFAPKCGGCKTPIMSESVNALGKEWHTTCFVCKECQKPFASGSFFDYENEPYCETHFHTKQGSLCAGCQRPIIGRCVTAIGKKFHPEHFVCQYCAKQLSKGAFKEAQGKPYCPGCHIKLFS